MKKITLAALALAIWGGSAQAGPILTTGTYTASGVAIVEPALVDAQSGQSPPGALPLLLSAYSNDGLNSAFGTGIADTGFLSAGTDITSVDAAVSAVGSSEYAGTFFAPDGTFRIRVELSNSAQANGPDATAETVFGLNLVSGTNVLWSFEYHYPVINDSQVLSQAFEQSFLLPVGTLTDFTVYALTTASATSPGAAFNLASVQFDLATVPEPSTLLALFAGLALLPFARKRQTAPDLALV